MRRLEFWLVFFILESTSGDSLSRILFVLRELGNGLVVTFSGRMRWLEWLIMHHSRGSRWLSWSMRNRWVLLQNLLVRVEGMCALNFLRERFLLNHSHVVLAFSVSKVFRPVVVVFHVRDFAAKVGLSTTLASLRRISQNIARTRYNFSWIFLILVIFLDFYKVSHMLI